MCTCTGVVYKRHPLYSHPLVNEMLCWILISPPIARQEPQDDVKYDLACFNCLDGCIRVYCGSTLWSHAPMDLREWAMHKLGELVPLDYLPSNNHLVHSLDSCSYVWHYHGSASVFHFHLYGQGASIAPFQEVHGHYSICTSSSVSPGYFPQHGFRGWRALITESSLP
jgi:hypothetical protein